MSTSGFNRTEEAPDYWNRDGRTATSVRWAVSLAPDEEVEWTWEHYPSGNRRVVGYTIRKKPR